MSLFEKGNIVSDILKLGNVAVITGAASGIGLATARLFAGKGMRIVMADTSSELDSVAATVEGEVLAHHTDVSDPEAVQALADATYSSFGRTDVLMNNAASRVSGGTDESLDAWHQAMGVNFWGAVHGERAFLPRMLAQKTPGVIVNTGSKQGITNPPGNTIYNVSKSALKTYSEQLQHSLRNLENCKISTCLLVPGWTTTGNATPNPGAWMPFQVAERLASGIDAGDFYIICPDNEVTTEMDNKRILWGAEDITENRPPLSRWHPDWKDRFSN